MNFSSRTLQQKVKGKWTVINLVTDQAKINALLCDEMAVKYIYKQRQVRKIKVDGIGITVHFNRKLKAVYAK